jgi:GT2 family glycosyltransferase
MKDFDHGQQCDVDQLMGAALMLRHSVIKEIGVLDERFFMYYEEVDLCCRIRASGRRIAFIPQATIMHLAGRSAEQVPAARRAMMLASMLAFFRKYRGGFKTAAFDIVFKPAVILAEMCRMFAGVGAFFYALISGNVKRKDKSLAKIRNSAAFLANHTWRLVFKM